MILKQATLDRVRRLNKRFTNKLLIHLCGRRSGHFAILTHTGRKSGNLYRIPIIAEPVQGGFVIALTYGKKVDWYENVMAKGGCSLRWKNRDYTLSAPALIDRLSALAAFPAPVRAGLKMSGTEYFLRLEVQDGQ
jgi:deazaflavin-dependent oxidoreductase (nitroreductase family)